MKGSNPGVSVPTNGTVIDETELELRPSGMLVQKREDGSSVESVGGSNPTITIKVSYDSQQFDVTVPSESSFGELKHIVSQVIGLEPKMQKLLFRGKEKDDHEYLHLAGVKDNSKVLIMEDNIVEEKKPEEATTVEEKKPEEARTVEEKKPEEVSRGCEAVAKVRAEVDKFSEQVAALQAVVYGGTKVEEKDIIYLTEMLMRQLLNLDGIEAEGEGRAQRKLEVRRVQSLVETVDAIKAKNANPFNDNSNAVSVTTQWETFDSGVGSLNAPPPRPSSSVVTQDWEQFD